MTRLLPGLLGLLLLLAGCGADVPVPDELDGADVSAMAEHELEQENPRMAVGTLSCPDLSFRVGSSVRCLRTTELSGGRVVKVGGTVTVTSLDAGGRLHVALDPQPQEFGLSGRQLAEEVRHWYTRHAGRSPGRLDCPYLRGAVGATVRCGVWVRGARHDVAVVVDAVDAARYATSYRARLARAG